MNNQCDLIKNKTSLDWATQLSGNPIGYDGNNAQLNFTCNPSGTSPIVSCPNNGEFKSIPGEECATYINGYIGMDISNNTSISVGDSSQKFFDTNFTFTPKVGINKTGQPMGCGCPNCTLNWPVTLSDNYDASGSLNSDLFKIPPGNPLPITGKFNINADIGLQSGYFPYPGNATKCQRVAYNAPKLGCCLNKKDVVQVFNGIPYTCDTNAISKYSLDCGASIADYCSTPDFFNFNGSPQNGYDNRNFKEWLVGGKCFNYFDTSSTKGKVGSNNVDALQLVLEKSIPEINKLYPVNNPGGDETLSFTNGFFQINYDVKGGINGMMINLNGSFEENDLINNIQNQINTGLGSGAITFGVTGTQFYMTPNQNGKIMQIVWKSPYADPTTIITLGGGNGISGTYSQGQTYIFPNKFKGVSMGKQIWDNIAYAVAVSKSGTTSLKEVCKNFTRKDIETSYSSIYPNDKILAKMCACNLSSNQYSNFGGKIPPSDYAVCDPLCLASGTVGRYKDFVPEVCNNTNCIIDNTTINFVNSTSEDISFNQVCSSGNGANCYFSDNEVFNEASKIGKVKINQNCGKCFVYNPSSPFEPTEVDCLTGELPVSNKIWDYIVKNKWVIIGISIGIILVIILLISLRNISSKTSQTQNLISALKS